MLRLLPQYKSAEIIRTRDLAVIATADIVVDVGAVYDPETLRFDHHQREFDHTFSSKYSTKLSSAGLIYKHFGRDILKEILGWFDPADAERLEILYEKIYEDVIHAYDGIDNGVSQYPADIKPVYKDSTGISHRVNALNPAWNQPSTPDILFSQFLKAVDLTGTEFIGRVKYLGDAWLPARKVVQTALETRTQIHPSGHIIVLDQFCPWKEHLHDLENELKLAGNDLPLYVLYGDSSASWRVQAVPLSPSSFLSRKALPEPWRGIRDDALSALTGVEGCVFVHATGFIGGCQTREGAIALAKLALEH
eukprot:jgi/Hompol1/1660/HPOL_004941-RA